MYLVVTTSFHPKSRSRLLAHAAVEAFAAQASPCELVDLRDCDLPPCDGDSCYGVPQVHEITEKIKSASGIILASPVYNYDLSANAKNLLELTGSAWTEKVVGILCAAGGDGSYMAPMGFCNSLMLDFRCLVVPRFVYVTDAVFMGDQIDDPEVVNRIGELVQTVVRVSAAVNS